MCVCNSNMKVQQLEADNQLFNILYQLLDFEINNQSIIQ